MSLNAIIIAVVALVVAWAAFRAVKRFRRGSACCGEHETVKRARFGFANKSDYSHTAELEIGGMTCDNCARRVENALNALDGVRARVRIDTHTATVMSRDPLDLAAVRKAVREAGYVVREQGTGNR